MVGALGKTLAQMGHEVHIITPLYRGIREKFPELRRVDWQFNLPLGAKWSRGHCGCWNLKTG